MFSGYYSDARFDRVSSRCAADYEGGAKTCAPHCAFIDYANSAVNTVSPRCHFIFAFVRPPPIAILSPMLTAKKMADAVELITERCWRQPASRYCSMSPREVLRQPPDAVSFARLPRRRMFLRAR